jgi:hypothetical protein
MTTARVLPDGRSTDYGCGLTVKSQNGRRVLTHTGAVSGFNAYNAVVPATRSAVVILCNCEGGIRKFPNQILALLLDEKSNVPQISGPKAVEAVKAVFAQFQRGKIDRKAFDDEFNYYLTEERMQGAAKRLKRFGNPKTASIVGMHERGGMECSTTQLTFAKGELTVQMCRMPNGKIAQFFVTHE